MNQDDSDSFSSTADSFLAALTSSEEGSRFIRINKVQQTTTDGETIDKVDQP